MIKKLVLAAALATIGTGSALADTFNAGLITPGTPVTNTFMIYPSCQNIHRRIMTTKKRRSRIRRRKCPA